MAVLEAIPGLTVTLVSNGQSLSEYPEQEEDIVEHGVSAAQRTSTYVECVTGTEFKIKFELSPTFQFLSMSISLRVKVDGTNICSVTLAPGCGHYLVPGRTVAQTTNERTIRPFQFSAITKVDDTDDHRITEDASVVETLGRIVVTAHNTNHEMKIDSPRSENVASGVIEIAEKALKGQAISHGISYGEECRIPYSNITCKLSFPDGTQNPRGVFILKYRSREALQSMLIIPRSPSPDPSPAMDFERIRTLEEELERIKSEIKKEHGTRKRGNGESDEVPHRERPYKVFRKKNGKTVVDLTDDD